MNNGTQLPNPLLAALKMPGRIFQLPSKGLLYKKGELSSKIENGEIQVKPLSAMGEIKLKTPDMLYSGLGIIDAIAECVPGIEDPGMLYCKDVDAILCFIRLVTYGENFTMKAVHDCENAKEHTYDINIEQYVQSMTMYSGNYNADYRILTPEGQEVLLRPLRFREAIKLMQDNEFVESEDLTAERIQKNVINNLLYLIESVDGITDKNMIDEWLRAITSKVTDLITDKINAANYWGVPSLSSLICSDCHEKMDVTVPINPSTFFTN